MDFKNMLKELKEIDTQNLSKREKNKFYKEEYKLENLIELEKIMLENNYNDKYIMVDEEMYGKVENITFKIERKKPVFNVIVNLANKVFVTQNYTGDKIHRTSHTYCKIVEIEPKMKEIIKNPRIFEHKDGKFVIDYYINPEI